MALKFGLHTRPYNISMPELMHLWRHGEDAGFDWISVFDHFYAGSAAGKHRPNYECLTALAALAATTQRVRVGCMAACMLYRHPSLFAKAAVTIDHISGGRAEFGLGAGWLEEEFRDFGYDFPPIGKRLDHLEEAIRIIRALFEQPAVTFEGACYQLHDAVCLPKPLQSRLPLWIGGLGERRTLHLAARYADGWNVHDVGPAVFAHKNQVLDHWCEQENRDPATIRRSLNIGFQMGADPVSAERKRQAVMKALPALRAEGELLGTAAEARDRIGQYADAGAGQINIGVGPPVDWDALAAFTEEVMPHFN